MSDSTTTTNDNSYEFLAGLIQKTKLGTQSALSSERVENILTTLKQKFNLEEIDGSPEVKYKTIVLDGVVRETPIDTGKLDPIADECVRSRKESDGKAANEGCISILGDTSGVDSKDPESWFEGATLDAEHQRLAQSILKFMFEENGKEQSDDDALENAMNTWNITSDKLSRLVSDFQARPMETILPHLEAEIEDLIGQADEAFQAKMQTTQDYFTAEIEKAKTEYEAKIAENEKKAEGQEVKSEAETEDTGMSWGAAAYGLFQTALPILQPQVEAVLGQIGEWKQQLQATHEETLAAINEEKRKYEKDTELQRKEVEAAKARVKAEYKEKATILKRKEEDANTVVEGLKPILSKNISGPDFAYFAIAWSSAVRNVQINIKLLECIQKHRIMLKLI